jgi:hypothetical protein
MLIILSTGIVALAAALIVYRIRFGITSAQTSRPPITAASISTIEAAFLRGGAAGVDELRAVAEPCGRELPAAENDAIERALRARGLLFEPVVVEQAQRVQRVAIFLAFVAVSVALVAEAAEIGRLRPAGLVVVVAGSYAIVLGLINALATIGRATPRGRAALAMRRAAYPANLVGPADPVEAIALYGGTLRRRDHRTVNAGGSDGDAFVWSGADAGGSGGGGHGGHGHGCSAGCGSH